MSEQTAAAASQEITNVWNPANGLRRKRSRMMDMRDAVSEMPISISITKPARCPLSSFFGRKFSMVLTVRLSGCII